VQLLELLLAFAAGGFLTWLVVRQQEGGKVAEATAAAAARAAAAEARLEAANDRQTLLDRAEQQLRDVFRSTAAEALQANTESVVTLATSTLAKFHERATGDLKQREQSISEMVRPIAETLKAVDARMVDVEKDRVSTSATLAEQLRALGTGLSTLQGETGRLVKALRQPHVRGHWGEVQLRQVVELAGMVEHTDFVEQETFTVDDVRMRPDLMVRLPGNKRVIVDAKTPLLAYLEAVEATDDEYRRQKLQDHASQVRTHMLQLSSKLYQEQFEPTPEFVVMFLPGETFFSAALEQDPALIERGVSQKVIPASPTTLIALLKAVAYGWNQEKLARNAQEISALGKELHDRLRLLGAHIENVGKGLDRAVESYNKAVGSLESRVMVSARKFVELGSPITEEIAELEPVETTTRNLTLDFEDPENAEATEPEGQGALDLNGKALSTSKASD
jgi:DNA recombination protein RmuC